MIHLKTITREPQRFAILLQPCHKGITCNEDLYAAVRKAGSARIHRFTEDSLKLEPDPVNVVAEKFCEEWEGD